MNHLDFLAIGVLRDDELINPQTARYLYVSMPDWRRAFYRARAAVQYNITPR